jgi:hypothetical protein
MSGQTTRSTIVAAFEHDGTMIVALELSGKSQEAGAVVPALPCRRCRAGVRDRATCRDR